MSRQQLPDLWFSNAVYSQDRNTRDKLAFIKSHGNPDPKDMGHWKRNEAVDGATSWYEFQEWLDQSRQRNNRPIGKRFQHQHRYHHHYPPFRALYYFESAPPTDPGPPHFEDFLNVSELNEGGYTTEGSFPPVYASGHTYESSGTASGSGGSLYTTDIPTVANGSEAYSSIENFPPIYASDHTYESSGTASGSGGTPYRRDVPTVGSGSGGTPYRRDVPTVGNGSGGTPYRRDVPTVASGSGAYYSAPSYPTEASTSGGGQCDYTTSNTSAPAHSFHESSAGVGTSNRRSSRESSARQRSSGRNHHSKRTSKRSHRHSSHRDDHYYED